MSKIKSINDLNQVIREPAQKSDALIRAEIELIEKNNRIIQLYIAIAVLCVFLFGMIAVWHFEKTAHKQTQCILTPKSCKAQNVAD